jgi:hypothetical protein
VVTVRAVQLVRLTWQSVETKITQEDATLGSVVERAEALPTLVTGVSGAANVQVFASADVKTVLAS